MNDLPRGRISRLSPDALINMAVGRGLRAACAGRAGSCVLSIATPAIRLSNSTFLQAVWPLLHESAARAASTAHSAAACSADLLQTQFP
jgi:hypothetical protein